MVPAFVVFGFAAQLILLGFFAAHLWFPRAADPLGRIAYSMGGIALVLAAASALTGQEWNFVLAFALYATWSAFGATIDILRPIEWRQPPRWSVLGPYAALLIAALLAFWVPLWWVDRALWVAFGVLYAAHTTMNVASHRTAGSGRASRSL